MDDVKLDIEVTVNSTEDLGKVKQAVEKIFGSLEIEEMPSQTGTILSAHNEGREALIEFRNLLRRERIRTAARKALFQSVKGDKITFFLNKQVAYVGHVSFCESYGESPLGPIRVHVISSAPRELISWLSSVK